MRHATSALLVAVIVVLAGCTTGPLGLEAGGGGATEGAASPQDADVDTTSATDAAATASPATGESASGTPGSASTPPGDATSPSPSPEPSEPDTADTVLILREEAGFDRATVAAVEAFDDVVVVGGTRNDEVALWSSTASDGTVGDRFADGFKVLVTARVDEAELPGPPLSAGELLLTPAGAALREGLDVGGQVTVGPDRTTLTVAAVADDQEPYGSAEVVLHPDDADVVGLEPLDRLFVVFEQGADVEAAAVAARALLGTDETRAVEVRDLSGGRGRRTLPVSTVKRLFGEFAFRDVAGSRTITQDPAWVDDTIVTTRVPLVGRVTCHRDVIEPLTAALTAISDAGLTDWVDPSRNGGCWAPRRTSEGGNLSKHAWGIAVDINVDFSLPGGGAVPPDVVIESFRANGFSWGGDYPTPDNHHWEYVGDE